MTSWTLTLPYERPPLWANQVNRGVTMGARMAKAAVASRIRHDVRVLAWQAKIPPQKAIHVRLHYQPRDRRRRDPDGLAPTFKHCLDGIVAAGVVPDDTQEYVDWSRPVIHPPVPGQQRGALWIVITPMEDA